MMMSSLRVFVLASFAYASMACSGPAKPVANEPVQPAVAEVDPSSTDQAIAALADELELAAREEEPSVTPVLQQLARDAGGELVGLEHRLKKRPSMLRKIRLQAGKHAVKDIVISDALRYTMRIEDDPEGSHVKTIVKVIAALEAAGHRIVKLKNYWPKGDNYSGVNSVLKSPSGLQWELQFHTADSLRIQKETRDSYEELREATTPVERKRELFDAMSLSWDVVHVPVDVLKPQSLHETEQIIQRPRP
jgi:hypothetical protein